MKIPLSSRGLFTLGFMILVVTNFVVLTGVASNRSGDPEALIKLTERELRLPYQIHEENSGLSLRLAWRTLGRNEDDKQYSGWRSPAWFNAEKLEELGFNIDDYISSEHTLTNYKRPIPKQVFVVLEYSGESYREALRRAKKALAEVESSLKLNSEDKKLLNNSKRAEERLSRERMSESRLFAVDVGADPKKLRKKYGDRTRFIITKGVVKPRYNYNRKTSEVFGYLARLDIESIHVPLKHRQVFGTVLARDKPRQSEFGLPRYRVELAYGSRLEPWILSVQHMDDKSD